MEHFVIPVGTLNKSNGNATAGLLRPADQTGSVFVGRLEIGLKRDASREIDRFAAAEEEREGELLEFVLLHIEVDLDVGFGGELEERGDGRLKALEVRVEIGRVEVGVEGGDLDGDAGAGKRAEVVRVEERMGGPLAGFTGERGDRVAVALAIGEGFGLGDTGFAEKIDGEGNGPLPVFPQDGLRGSEVFAGDEGAGHAADLRGEESGRGGGEEFSGGHAEAKSGREVEMAKVFMDVLLDLVGVGEHGEDVNEAEELGLEGFITKGQRHEAVGKEARGGGVIAGGG